jgi:hypothetical protein
MASNETPKYKLSVVEGTELQLSLSGPAGPAGVSGTITTSTSTNLTGYIFGNGTNIAGATAAASAGYANTLVLRSATGSAEFNAEDGGAAAVTGYSAGSGGTGLFGLDLNGDGFGAYGEGGLAGVYGNTTDGIGVDGYSINGTGSKGYSQNATGGESVSAGTTATYHHKFGDTGNNRSAVERIRGWFVWFFSTFTGRLKTADITANREWTLPDESGTIALARNTSRTIYVDTNGTDTRGSLSQYSVSIPFATIGAAMAASVSGDTVRVRAGSYTITSTISLNGEGNLHLEEGAVVTCSVSGPVFSLTANESKSISGGGQFIITGSTTTFWLQSGGGPQTQLCSFECATISTTTSPLNAATIFDVSTGVLVVNAETVYALASTIISCAGTSSNLHYAVKFTYCSRFAHFPTSGSSARMSCDCWTIACYGPKCFQIVGGTVGAKYETLLDSFGNCTFFSLEYGNDSTVNELVIKGGRAITYSLNPCINFTTTTGTNKFVRLIGDPFFYTNATNSISAASARSVLCSFASSNKAVNSSFVTIVGGTYAVNAGFIL